MQKRRRHKRLWLLWLILTLGASGYLFAALTSEDSAADSALAWGKHFFVPGQTTHGHHQIELACNACHTKAFGDREEMQDACLDCHDDELEAANDTHPVRLFTDPRNFQMLEAVDARFCVSCHVEHKPEITRAIGVTIQTDHCLVCHRDVAETRPTHEGLEPGSCAAAGCHNYHDNRALYQEFLLKHVSEPALFDTPIVEPHAFSAPAPQSASYPPGHDPHHGLTSADQDGGGHLDATPKLLDDWAATAHAQADVNCSGCHRAEADDAWVTRPDRQVCASCHESQVEGWLAGMHGMRVAQGLSPMTPAQAELPMKPDAAHEQMTCNSCHTAHRFDTRQAAVDACVQCHDDEHTRAFSASPHFEAWQREISGAAPPGSGVSCATCHMPRVTQRQGGTDRVRVQHNQNNNLRPVSKMARPVCMDCHGLQFALDALADKRLIDNNFSGEPSHRVESLDMAQRAAQQHRDRQKQTKAGTNQK